MTMTMDRWQVAGVMRIEGWERVWRLYVQARRAGDEVRLRHCWRALVRWCWSHDEAIPAGCGARR
jgi:hypothetical protein